MSFEIKSLEQLLAEKKRRREGDGTGANSVPSHVSTETDGNTAASTDGEKTSAQPKVPRRDSVAATCAPLSDGPSSAPSGARAPARRTAAATGADASRAVAPLRTAEESDGAPSNATRRLVAGWLP
eukprot:6174655-Pleurochrysis_carterae.AAC.5